MYQIISHLRTENTLVLNVKRDLARRPPVPTVFGIAVLVVIALAAVNSPNGGLFLLGCVAGLLALALIFRLVYLLTLRETLVFDAGSLEVRRQYGTEFLQRSSSLLYDRKNVPKPFSLVHSNVKRRFQVDQGETMLFETVIPFCEFGYGGIVCVQRNKTQMLIYEAIFEKFFNEVPYDPQRWKEVSEAVDHHWNNGPSDEERSIATLVKRQTASSNPPRKPATEKPPKKSESKRERLKSYSIDRGETPINRGDDFSVRRKNETAREHGARPLEPQREADASLERLRGAEPMVRISQTVDTVRRLKTITLYSQRGGPLSIFLGNFSYHLNWILQTVIFFTLIGTFAFLFVRWNAVEPKILEYVKTTLVPNEVPEHLQEDAFRGIAEYENLNPVDRNFSTVIVGLILFFAVPGLLIAIVSKIVRWPFWKYWRLRIDHSTRLSNQHENEAVYTWGNDRSRWKEPRTLLSSYFYVIKAKPGMNPLMTGRSRFTRNPAWREPYQVVLRSDENTYVLPCADEEEQTRIAALLNEFLTVRFL